MDSSHFPFVCSTCKWRKKACDKKLPSCTYCSKRSIACHYPDSPSAGQHGRSHASASAVADWRNDTCSSSGVSVESLAATSRAHLLLIHSISDHAYLLPLSGFPTLQESTFDGIVHKQVSRILQTTGLSVEIVQEQLPSAIWSSLAVVQKNQFISYQHAVSSFTPPTADMSVLILATALLSLRGEDDTRSDLADLNTLYLTVKMLYAQVQTMISMSISVVQTGILIAVFEFSSGRCHAALLTLATCTAMLQQCKINIRTQNEQPSEPSTAASLEVIRWHILVCERFVLPYFRIYRTLNHRTELRPARFHGK